MSLHLYRHNNFIQRLLDQELLTQGQLEEALELRKTSMAGADLLTIFVSLGYVNLEQVCHDLAQRFEIEFVSLAERAIPPEVRDAIEPRIARFYRVIPYKEEGGALIAATDDPTNVSVFETLSSLLGRPVQPALATPDDVSSTLKRLYGDDGQN